MKTKGKEFWKFRLMSSPDTEDRLQPLIGRAAIVPPDALLTPEGREYLRREFQEAPTNALPVVTPK